MDYTAPAPVTRSTRKDEHVHPQGYGIIAMHLRESRQLFDVMDPSPFREKDLDPKAELYIVESAKELRPKSPCALHILIDMPTPADESELGAAIREHFARRAQFLKRDLRALLRRGWISLLIGITFLAIVFTVARLVENWLGDRPVGRLTREGMVIFGWVAMWRPLEIFLYDWWPILGEQRLRDRLSRLEVRVLRDDS